MPFVEKVAIDLQTRSSIALIIVGAILAALVFRLWQLQVVRGEYYLTLSEQNRLRELYIPPSRGEIYDRYGRVIAKNRPAFNLEFVAEDAPDRDKTIKRLAEVLELDHEVLLKRAEEAGRRRKYEPRLLMRDISRDQVARVWAHKHELPGVMTNVTPARQYLHGELAAHLLGYIREITKGQLSSSRYDGYQMGDVVGQAGLESQWESQLQGTRGIQMVVVNAVGVKTGESAHEPDRPGNNIVTTLDLDVQKAADRALDGIKGAIVAMDPRTGEILALASHPGFDPNIFAGELPAAVWNDIRAGPGKKLNNRAIQGGFAPGSVFKIWVALAALAEKVIDEHERINCPGFMRFGGRAFRCHKRQGHGPVNLFEAMVQSCDVYFYTIGDRLGVDRIHDYATRYGLGEITGISLPDEIQGIVPSRAWKRSYFKDPANQTWFPGETLSVAIGQGAVSTTPLQITRALAAVVNGGRVLRPLLVKGVYAPDGTLIENLFRVDQVDTVEIDPAIVAKVRDTLVGVVHDAKGTARRARLEGKKSDPLDPSAQPNLAPSSTDQILEFGPIQSGGKTGTAQVVALEAADLRDEFKDHAWYSAYAPADNPEIVVTALIENGGSGGAVAAPLVRQVMEAYFYRKPPLQQNGESIKVTPEHEQPLALSSPPDP